MTPFLTPYENETNCRPNSFSPAVVHLVFAYEEEDYSWKTLDHLHLWPVIYATDYPFQFYSTSAVLHIFGISNHLYSYSEISVSMDT